MDFISFLVWLLLVYFTYRLAKNKKRNIIGWVAASMFIPFIPLIILAFLGVPEYKQLEPSPSTIEESYQRNSLLKPGYYCKLKYDIDEHYLIKLIELFLLLNYYGKYSKINSNNFEIDNIFITIKENIVVALGQSILQLIDQNYNKLNIRELTNNLDDFIKNPKVNYSITAVHLDGIPFYENPQEAKLESTLEHLKVDDEFIIPYDLIIDATVRKEDIKEVITNHKKQKVIERSVVGSLIFGPAGAIIGGATAPTKTETKEETKETVYHLIIKYKYEDGIRTADFIIHPNYSSQTIKLANIVAIMSKKGAPHDIEGTVVEHKESTVY